MISSGIKVSDIANMLHLSPKTVNSYRYRIFEKTNLDNDVALALLLIKNGMLDDVINNTEKV